MKKQLLITVGLLFGAPAYAWDGTNTGSGQLVEQGAAAQSRALAGATSTSHSGATATGGNATAAGGRSSSHATGGRGGSVNIGSIGGSSVGSGTTGISNGGFSGVVTVPDGYGNAPCGGGVSLGGAGGFGGGSGGGTLWEFGDCKRMRESAALRSLGYPDAALAELCQIDRVRDAFGGKCPVHEAVAVTAPPPERYRYDFCYTSSAGELAQHKECFNGR